jgi:hypothetical protein
VRALVAYLASPKQVATAEGERGRVGERETTQAKAQP